MFSNEHCEGVSVAREPSESLEHRDWRALVKVAQWYRRHLKQSVPVILLSEQVPPNPKFFEDVFTWK